MNGTWVPALLLALVPPQGDTAPLSPAAFRDRFAASVRATTGQQTTDVDERTFTGRMADGTDLTGNIDNAYQQYLAYPAELDIIVARFSRLLAAKTQMDEIVDQLVIVVRPSDYLELSMGQGADKTRFPSPLPLAGDVSQFLAVDSSETIRLATADDLARWKLDGRAAWAKALVNLKVRMGPLSPAQLGDEAGVDGLTAQSGLASGLLADPALCGKGGHGSFEGFLALLYSRDLVVIADPSDRGQRDRFWRRVRAETAVDRTLSRTPLTCRDGRWAVAPPP